MTRGAEVPQQEIREESTFDAGMKFARGSSAMKPASVCARLRVAAAGDLHCTTNQPQDFQWLETVHEFADVLLLAGDLTENGTPAEAERIASVLERVRIPVVCVLGNHDLAAGMGGEVTQALQCAGVQVLANGARAEIGTLGIVGITGASGGFGDDLMLSRSDPKMRELLELSLREADALSEGLRQLKTPKKIALMHYSPVVGTLAGESRRIQRHLGCAFLEHPFSRFPAHAVFHGHAHHGSPMGHTRNGTPVYNVAEPVLKRHQGKSFKVIDLGASVRRSAIDAEAS